MPTVQETTIIGKPNLKHKKKRILVSGAWQVLWLLDSLLHMSLHYYICHNLEALCIHKVNLFLISRNWTLGFSLDDMDGCLHAYGILLRASYNFCKFSLTFYSLKYFNSNIKMLVLIMTLNNCQCHVSGPFFKSLHHLPIVLLRKLVS